MPRRRATPKAPEAEVYVDTARNYERLVRRVWDLIARRERRLATEAATPDAS